MSQTHCTFILPEPDKQGQVQPREVNGLAEGAGAPEAGRGSELCDARVSRRPLAIDLYCGLGGWAEGLLDAGFRVVGFDIERHRYWLPESLPNNGGGKGTRPVEKRGWTQGCAVSLGLEGATARPRTRLIEYPGELVLQDVTTLHGQQFRDAALIVASPPCQAYSYRAMPWKRAKALPPPDNTLFDACFRIQREASEAAGRHVPLVVENVKGAQKWVGQARWHFGSYYLWGDVPAIMPPAKAAQKFNPDGTSYPQGSWFKIADSKNRGSSGQKVPVYSDPRRNGGRGVHLTHPRENHEGVKVALSGRAWFTEGLGKVSSKCDARKAASALIAKIPRPLARWIGDVYFPHAEQLALDGAGERSER